MSKNLKYLLGFLFFIIWVIAIIIGYNKGKKATFQNTTSDSIVTLDKELPSVSDEKKLLAPKPLLFKLDQQIFKPFDYSIKIGYMAEDITIIDEKGNRLKPSQSDKMALDLFTINIMDHDLREEESLKKAIQFPIEKGAEEEYYRGMVEESDKENKMEFKKEPSQEQNREGFQGYNKEGTNTGKLKSSERLKSPGYQIYTN